MTENVTETNEILVSDFFEAESYSPYGVIKVANEILKALEIEKVLPGPMGYTYCKKGYIKTQDEAKKVVAKADAIEWVEGYLGRLAAKQTLMAEKVEAEESSVEDELEVQEMGEAELLVSE